MRFDFGSFLIGFATAAVIGFVLYRLRGVFGRARQRLTQTTGEARNFLSASPEARYSARVMEVLNAYHLLGERVALKDIALWPRFVAPPAPILDLDKDDPSVLHVVPMVHEFPASYAPYNVESLTVGDLQKGERHIAILGGPGMGKSTALAVIGLVAAGQMELPVLEVTVEEAFADELQGLNPDERARQIKNLKEQQERALEQLRRSKGGKDEDETPTREVARFRTLMPILVHLRDIDLRPEAYGILPQTPKTGKTGELAEGDKAKAKRATQSAPQIKPLDPAEPLVAALQRRFGGAAASTLAKPVYRRLKAGAALVLIDGYEDLLPEERPAVLRWLAQFLALYGRNFIIVTGPVSGYDGLLNVGFMPCYLRAWTDNDYATLAEKWAAAWPEIGKVGRKAAPAPDAKAIDRAKTGVRGRSMLDVTLKIWADYAGDVKETGRRGWYDAYVRRTLPDHDTMRPILEEAAAAMLNGQGLPSRESLKAALTSRFTGPDGKPTGDVEAALRTLTRAEVLLDLPGDRYVPRHPLIGAFLAAESLDASTVVQAANNPLWADAMPFAAARLPMDAAVGEILNAPADLLYSNVFGMTYWLPDSPSDAKWRGEFFRRLSAALLANSQFPTLRERAMAALVTSRDKGVFHVFRQALAHANPLVRRLGCIGLGALGDQEAVRALSDRLADDDQDVRLAAGFALGVIGSPGALEALGDALGSQDQNLQRAVAEALAAIPGEGHTTLREMIKHKDDLLRRAAVFGLARVGAAWAIALIYRAQIEDSVWYVRDAASQAFVNAAQTDFGGLKQHPNIDQLAWLMAFMNARGEVIPTGQNARQALIRALQEGETPVLRAAAARTLGNLGYVREVRALYNALKDREEPTRAAVYEALGSLQTRLGEKLPAVM